LTENIINKEFNGDNLKENIRLIEIFNPYKRRKFTAE